VPETILAMQTWIGQVEAALAAKDYYEALQLAEDATAEDIAARRRDWAKSYHPDLVRSSDLGPLGDRLDAAWKGLNTASSVLSDEEKRKEYDIFLDRKRRGLPTDPRAVVQAEELYQEGARYLRGHKYKDALECFRRSLELNPQEPEVKAASAWCDYVVAKGAGELNPTKIEEAKTALQQAVESSAALATARFYLALLLKDQGRNREALSYFQETIGIDPYHVDAKREIRYLQQRQASGKQEKKRGFFSFGRKKK